MEKIKVPALPITNSIDRIADQVEVRKIMKELSITSSELNPILLVDLEKAALTKSCYLHCPGIEQCTYGLMTTTINRVDGALEVTEKSCRVMKKNLIRLDNWIYDNYVAPSGVQSSVSNDQIGERIFMSPYFLCKAGQVNEIARLMHDYLDKMAETTTCAYIDFPLLAKELAQGGRYLSSEQLALLDQLIQVEYCVLINVGKGNDEFNRDQILVPILSGRLGRGKTVIISDQAITAQAANFIAYRETPNDPRVKRVIGLLNQYFALGRKG